MEQVCLFSVDARNNGLVESTAFGKQGHGICPIRIPKRKDRTWKKHRESYFWIIFA